MDASEVEALEATNEKILEMKESVTNNVLTMAGDVEDEETQVPENSVYFYANKIHRALPFTNNFSFLFILFKIV